MTTQELPERRPAKVDLNLLPAEYLPKKTPRLTIILVLALIVVACLPWPFLVLKGDVDAENRGLVAERDALQSQYTLLLSTNQLCEKIQKDIKACQDTLLGMQADYAAFTNSLYAWSIVFYDIQQIPKGTGGSLGAINQKGEKITIDGLFSKERYIYEYAWMLQETGHFVEDGIDIVKVQLVQTAEGNFHKFKIEAELMAGGE